MKLKGLPIERDIWERFYAQMITALIIIIFPRKRYYIFIILAGEFPQDLSKFIKIESLLVMRELKIIEHLKKIMIYFKWLKIYLWYWMHNMKCTAFLQLIERKVF